jgi:hypothetical protein
VLWQGQTRDTEHLRPAVQAAEKNFVSKFTEPNEFNAPISSKLEQIAILMWRLRITDLRF